MTFEEDLTKRRIDVAAFATGDPEKFAAWQLLYQQVHPNTFYTAVKMIINDVRRRFWLAEAPKPAAAPTPAAVKPVIRRATVPSTASAIPDEPSPSVDRTPEPAPRARAVIRRPPKVGTDVAAEQESETEKPLSPEKEVGSIPKTSKPERARPVFRRPTSASDSKESATENQTTADDTATPEPTKEDVVKISKPPRPRPVIRKPVASATNSTEADRTEESSAKTSTNPLPEHSNPNPAEMPKSPRPRPVFKRPAPVSSTETEKITALPEIPDAELKVESKSATIPEAPTTETPKFPRPRPVIKRPAEPSTAPSTPIVNPEQKIVNPASTIQAQVVKEERSIAEDAPTPEVSTNPLAPKPPRPRPVFKRPAKPELPDDTVTNDPEKE